MASDDLKLLLQSLRRSCDTLQEIYDGLSDPSIFKPEWAKRWIQKIAEDITTTITDLRKWCTQSEQIRHFHDDTQYRSKMDPAEWIAELSVSMKETLGKVSSEETSKVDVVTSLGHASEDIDGIEKQIKEIKQLDSLPVAHAGDLKSAVRQNQRNARTIELLFREHLRFESQKSRANSFGIIERGCIGLDQMSWFWRKIPCPPGLEHYQSGGDERHDGVLISPAMIERARAVLEMFISAWILVCGDPVDRPSLDSMLDMPTIACVLNACGRQASFNHFITAEIKDSALEDNWDRFAARVEAALQSTSLAKEIVGQFSRIRQRRWLDGEHLKLERSEPLPLCQVDQLREKSGSSGLVAVVEVQDVWEPANHYALKVVSTRTATHKQLQDLMNEIEHLTKIGRENHGHHIVQCVKTYERGGSEAEIGMLLRPVAKFDLNKFLIKCCKDPPFRRASRDYLVQAFGCVSYSLAYLHNVCDMRHRDLKPGNILVHYPSKASDPPNFLLADFGLAFVFREQGFSGEENPDFGATLEYEAPEIDRSRGSFHTRAADVFALGLTFLEIVWVLTIKEKEKPFGIGLREKHWDHATRRYYKHHLLSLNSWIQLTHDRLKKAGDRTLCMILVLAQRMIRPNPDDRPKIGDVVKEMWSFKYPDPSKKTFCDRCITKMKVDLSTTPQHRTIFDHKPSVREIGRNATRPRPLGPIV